MFIRVVVRASIRLRDIEVVTPIPITGPIETLTISHLPRLENLNHFSLYIYRKYVDRNLIACFSSMQHLRSLRLIITDEDTLHCFVHDLHYLKNLTSLHLICFPDLQNDLEPNSSVQGLSQLEMGFKLLVNRRGELIFPMLSGLTSLDVYYRLTIDPRQFPPNLQVCQLLCSSV